KGFSWGRVSKTLSFWILLFLVPFGYYQYTQRGQESGAAINYSRYRQEVERGNVSTVLIEVSPLGLKVRGEFKEPIVGQSLQNPTRRFQVQLPIADQAEIDLLKSQGVTIEA